MSLFKLTRISSNILKNKIKKRFITYYTDTHEWVKLIDDNKNAIIGITEYAQRELGDIIYCDLEEVDTKLNIGDICSTIESVKASIDIQTPISGEIIEVNVDLSDNSVIINESTMNEG